MEAAGLAGFVIVAGSAATLLEYAGSPVQSEVLRRVVLGSVMAVCVAALFYSP